MKIRAFIAFEIPTTPALRKQIRTLNEMGNALKAVNPDHLHLTLKFLGDIEAEMIPEISSRIEQITSKAIPVELVLERLGVFPYIRRPLVIWAGVDQKNGDHLRQMAAELDETLSELGFPTEKRLFQPHVTLARIKRKPPELFFEYFNEKNLDQWGEVTCETLYLVQSELTPQGSVYHNLASFPLGK